MSKPMSEAPAVIEVATQDRGLFDYIRKDIFDAYRKAIKALLAFHGDKWFFDHDTSGEHIEDRYREVIDLAQAARKAGESVK